MSESDSDTAFGPFNSTRQAFATAVVAYVGALTAVVAFGGPILLAETLPAFRFGLAGLAAWGLAEWFLGGQ